MGRKLWTGLRQVNRNHEDRGRWTEFHPGEIIGADKSGGKPT
jgi:hypothetical protein